MVALQPMKDKDSQDTKKDIHFLAHVLPKSGKECGNAVSQGGYNSNNNKVIQNR